MRGSGWRRPGAVGLALAFAGALIGSAHADAPSNRFEPDVRAFEAADRATPPPPNPILFLGSSTITRWSDLAAAFPGFTVLNRGFGGSQLTDVLHFFDRVVVPYAPALIVLYEGDNDLAGGKTVDQVFADWTNFSQRVAAELPGTGVLFLSVKPSPSRAAFLGTQREFNRRIAADCNVRARCGFVDLASAMLDGAGRVRGDLFVSDQLHLNPAGYELWRAVIAPELESWAAAHPERSVRAPLNALLIDFGSDDLPSARDSAGGVQYWNNISSAVGATSQGRVSNLVTVEGATTTAAWVMTSRFNGANLNGTTAPAPFPTSATRDSLFGNTETFSGLANVTPAFRLTGLRTGMLHHVTFYASRTGVSDNRETRYTVTGATVAAVDLNAANNVAEVARVTGIEPGPDGALAVALAPGPRNNNANHFVYLGAMQLEEAAPGGRVFRFDLGAPDSLTGPVGSPAARWNDVLAAVGRDPNGAVQGLVAIDGTDTGIGLRMTSPFAAANKDGTDASTVFPSSATLDSLSGGATPAAFRLVGLDPGHAYSLGFYASQMGFSDRRETRYVVRGAEERSTRLEPANNTNRLAWVTAVRPDAAREILVVLEPGPANDSPGPYTGLGALRLEWRRAEVPPRPTLSAGGVVEGKLRLRLGTARGRSCLIERSADLVQWDSLGMLTPPSGGLEIGSDTGGGVSFFRLVDAP